MTVEEQITAVLETVVDRVFPDVAPLSTPRPYVTYQQIGGQPVSFVDPTLPDLKNGEFQVNVWADSRAQATALMLQIEAALLAAAAFDARPMSAPVSTVDTPIYGARQDFSVWSAR